MKLSLSVRVAEAACKTKLNVSFRDLVQLAKEMDLPLMASNDCHYLRREDAEAHDALLCIQTGKGISDPTRMKFPNEEFYVKTPEEMWEIFSEVPEALRNTEAIAERCNVVLNFEENHLPRFPVPEDQTLNDYFEHVVTDGFDLFKVFLFYKRLKQAYVYFLKLQEILDKIFQANIHFY